MLGDVFDMLFGCWHRHYSFPLTAKKGNKYSHAANVTGTYVVCLDCGKEFPYDWNQMKMLSSGSERTNPAPLVAKPVTDFVKAA